MKFDGQWTLGLPGDAEPPADGDAPLMTNGKVGVLLSFASPQGLDTSRAIVAAPVSSGLRYGTMTDAFHPCRFRLLTAGGEELRQTLLVSDDPLLSLTLDMEGAVMYAPFICVRPSDGAPVCVAMHSVRALRHMPHFMLHTLALTVAPGHQEGLQVLHELRADASLLDPRFDSTVINGPAGGTYMMTARGTSSSAREVFATSTYLFDEPELTVCCGFNARRRSAAPATAFTRLQMHAEGDGSSEHTYAIHVLTGTMTSDDNAVDAGEQLRRVILGQLASLPASAEDAVTALCNRHVDAWNVLWMSDVWFDIKPDASPQELARALRFQGMLRYAVYNLHASARHGSVVDLAGTFANGAADAWIVPALLLLQTDAGLGALDAHHAALPDASRAASAFGFRGAKFPFQGDDASGTVNALQYEAEGPLRMFNCALVAIAAWDYYRISMDRDWLQEHGYALLRGVADLIVSAAQRDADSATLYHLRNVVGFDDAFPPATDNALSVASALCALRCAIEASYELGYYPKYSWTSVRYGLVVPLSPTDVVLRDAAPTSAPPAGGHAMRLEPLMVLQPQLNDAAFGPDSGRSLGSALKANVQAWASESTGHPIDRMLLAYAQAQLAQTEVRAADAQAAVAAFFAAFDDPTPDADDDGWGNLEGFGAVSAFNDLNLSALLVLAVAQGLAGISLTGGVTETRFYYMEMGVVAAFSAALPMSWERLFVRGVGPAQKDFSVLNHLLYPSARMGDVSMIVPWSVAALTS
jgi:hypothetical protein